MVFKCGYVAIVGRPNVGKSTLLNSILGEHLAIVTPKPQTTRHKITGIYNRDDAQIVFLDTPGYHLSSKPLNQIMTEVVGSVIHKADIICLILEVGQKDVEIEKGLFDRIGAKRTIVILNKCDLVNPSEYDALAVKFRDEWGARELVVMSALKNLGVATLLEAIERRIPAGEPLYPTDTYTTHPVRFIAAELIREQVFSQMHQEIPYAAAVMIEEFKEATDEKSITVVRALIVVEKDSQKAMVIGRGGSRIREIGKKSRLAIEELIGGKVYLDLNVRVEKDWTKDRDLIRKIGCTSQLE